MGPILAQGHPSPNGDGDLESIEQAETWWEAGLLRETEPDEAIVSTGRRSK